MHTEHETEEGEASDKGASRKTHRIRQIADTASWQSLIDRLVDVAFEGLPAMFLPEQGTFIHSLHRVEGAAPRPVGESIRYAAMVALGARWLQESEQREVFAGQTAAEFIESVLRRADTIQDSGDLAAVCWAANSLECQGAAPASKRLYELVDSRTSMFTVELAWSLSAAVAGRGDPASADAAKRISARLRSAFRHEAGVFSHVVGGGGGGLRGHVACFADQVYPIQALARHHAAFGDDGALADATRCGEQICRVQGPEGQWWWHYDSRNGSVVEGYPVYSVHQDAMGPMCLFDLQEAGGPDFSEAIRLGLGWMDVASEVGHSLIDDEQRVIWRKVGRAEPGKLTRGVRAVTSRIHPSLRLHALDGFFPTTRIDYECRPYHLGWVLDTWLAR